jgi:hypothetical protein
MTKHFIDPDQTPRPDLRVVVDNTTQEVEEFAQAPETANSGFVVAQSVEKTVFDQDAPELATDHHEPEGQTVQARPLSEANAASLTKEGLKVTTADVLGITVEEMNARKPHLLKRAVLVGKGALQLCVETGKSIVGIGEDRTITNPAEGLADMARKQKRVAMSTDGTSLYRSKPDGPYRSK